MADFYLISMLAFIGALAVFFFLDRKNVERQSILLLRKTSKGRGFLTWLGQRFPRIWWVYGMAAVGIGFFMSAYILYFMFDMTVTNLTQPSVPGLALVLPSPTAQAVSGPGVLGVPFWFWIISIFLLIIVHEGSHGLLSAREKVKIKSLGWGLLAVIPLAFVEPDEKQLEKEKPMKQLRVFAAGSFGNFVLAFVSGLTLVWMITAFFVPSGVGFQGYIDGYPAQQVNLTGTITGIDNYTVNTVQDLETALQDIGPGSPVTITTMSSGEEMTYHLTTVQDPDSGRAFIGIAVVTQEYSLVDGVVLPDVVYFLTGTAPGFTGLLFFLYLINFGVGAFNLLPIGPLDGGRMWKILLDKGAPRYSRAIMNGLSYVILVLIILNFATALL